jgi:hypothetical protein
VTLSLLALLVATAPAQAGVGKRLAKSAARVAGKAIVHSKQAEDAVKEAAPPAADAGTPANSVAGITPITPATASPPAVVTTAPVMPRDDAAAGEDRAPALTVDALGDSVEVLPASLRENSYFYSSFGTQDPFRSLLAGDFTPKLQELVDIHTVQMVGVIWQPDEVAAMVQDAQGFGYTLRPGDAVKNGSVVAVRQDALVARLNIFGQTTQVTLRLQRDEE